MRVPVTRYLFRLNQEELKRVIERSRHDVKAVESAKKVIEQSYYDYDMFVRCSLDNEDGFVTHIYCFDDVGLALVHYSNGDIELVTQDQYYCIYSLSNDNSDN